MTYKTYKVRVHDDGTQEWLNQDGKLHRDDGPAIVRPDGSQAFYVDGKRHRDDGPAIARPDSYQEFWVDGKRHRDDGPAIAKPDGYQEFWVDGKLHRDDGPAVVWPDGYQEFYVDGKRLTEEEFNQRTKGGDTCDGKVVEIDGQRYRLNLV